MSIAREDAQAPTPAADGMANPAVERDLAFLMVWNGTTWDRLKSTPFDGSGPTGYPSTLEMVFNGASWDKARTPNKFIDIPSVAVVAGTPATIWTPAAGKKFRLMGYSLAASVAGQIIFKYAAANTVLFRTPTLVAATPHGDSGSLGNGAMPGAANDALKIDVTVGANVSGLVWGTEE